MFDFTIQQQQQQQQQLSLLSQASWGRLEMKTTRNKERRSTKHKNTKAQKKKGRSCLRHIDCKGIRVSTQWVDKLQSYVGQWTDASDHVVAEKHPHDDATWTAYLTW
jgi:hypothetical protein